jgi:hypothetical protein
MSNLRAKESERGESAADVRHHYHNPLIKALSNSDLFDNSLNEPPTAEIVNLHSHQQAANTRHMQHSAVNLLDLSNDELSFGDSFATTMHTNKHAMSQTMPPRRPPPPLPSQANKPDPFKVNEPTPLITIDSASSLGFDDDFGSFGSLQNKQPTTTAVTHAATRPPPLPPLLPVKSSMPLAYSNPTQSVNISSVATSGNASVNIIILQY